MTTAIKSTTVLCALLAGTAFGASGCSAGPPSEDDISTTGSDVVTQGSIASLALANVGKGACSKNSRGSYDFASSCTGNGGQPEYWCADFARWVWAAAGASNTSELTAAAGSFYVYGQKHGTLHSKPVLGDAVVFNYSGNGYADHVALVTQVNSNGTIETVSGDWGGQSGSEAHFSATSHAILNAPAYSSSVGSTPGIMGMR
ncbi:MAG TPA: CHAP domain-containing protein, partial [Polyangiaceae bacterium]